MNGFVRLPLGALQLPWYWQPWIAALVVCNLVVPLFYLGRLEAQVVLGTFLLAGALMGVLTHRFGFSRILGLAHFPWLLLLPWLWTRLGSWPLGGGGEGDGYALWLRILIGVNGLSLLIDLVDVVRWLRGERQETVEL